MNYFHSKRAKPHTATQQWRFMDNDKHGLVFIVYSYVMINVLLAFHHMGSRILAKLCLLTVCCSPGEDSRLKLGAYLVHSQFQTSSHTSALFLTAAAQNLLCLKLAADYIGTISNPFGTWFIGALVPAILGGYPQPCDFPHFVCGRSSSCCIHPHH